MRTFLWTTILLVAAMGMGPARAQEPQQTPGREVRNSMWDLWQATVQAPSESSGQREDANTQTPEIQIDPVVADRPAEATQPGGQTPELQGIRTYKDELIPVHLGLGSRGQDPINSVQPARPKEQQPQAAAETQQVPSSSQHAEQAAQQPDQTDEHTQPQARQEADEQVAGNDAEPADQADPQPQTDNDNSPAALAIPDDLPATLKARIQAAQAGAGNDPAELMSLGDNLYKAEQIPAAEYFYRLALPRSEKADRPWILLQIGNCLRNRDVARAREKYQLLIQEYPNSPWAEVAQIQDRILRWRIKNRSDLETEVDEVLAKPNDPYSNL